MANQLSHTRRSTDDLYAGSLVRLVGLFYAELDELGRFEAITADDLPADYQILLAHTNHMTVTLEAFHNSLVDVRVLDEWRDESSYARRTLLARQTDGVVVQLGIMRIWLTDLDRDVQREIREKTLPLGRVLIRHNVLRDVELMTFWRVTPGAGLREQLGLAEGEFAYGRTAQILVDHRPTVQLLEIVTLPGTK